MHNNYAIQESGMQLVSLLINQFACTIERIVIGARATGRQSTHLMTRQDFGYVNDLPNSLVTEP